MVIIVGVKPLVWPMMTSLIARFMGPTWGPSGADRTQVDPMLATWTLLSRLLSDGPIRINVQGPMDYRLPFTVLLLMHMKRWINVGPISIPSITPGRQALLVTVLMHEMHFSLDRTFWNYPYILTFCLPNEVHFFSDKSFWISPNNMATCLHWTWVWRVWWFWRVMTLSKKPWSRMLMP